MSKDKAFMTREQHEKVWDIKTKLAYAFPWDESPQGYKFWVIVYEQLNKLASHPEEYVIDYDDSRVDDTESESVSGGSSINPFT